MLTDFEKRLKRLYALSDADNGFYVLALHSFWEAYAEQESCASLESDFYAKINALKDNLSQHNSWADLKYFQNLMNEHALTNTVRHSFSELGEDDAIGATSTFIACAKICQLYSKDLFKDFENKLENWTLSPRVWELLKTVRDLETKLAYEKEGKKSLMQLMEEQKADLEHIDELRQQIHSLKQEEENLERSSAAEQKEKRRIEQLRNERFTLKERIRQQEAQYKEMYAKVDEYIQHFRRFKVLMQTRKDYEQSILVLTPEQKQLLNSANLNKSLLIRGHAGTGKSLVLLKALEKAWQDHQSQLLHETSLQPFYFLTFTSTLTKYSQYLIDLLGLDAVGAFVMTVEAFFKKLLGEFEPDAQVQWNAISYLIGSTSIDGLEAKELYTEIESFLWTNDVSYEEYVTEMIPRRGLGKALKSSQRQQVWELKEAYEKAMDGSKRYSKAYSRIKILQYMEQKDDFQPLCERLFLDESQDLGSCEIKILNICARQALIMAGDPKQSLYGFSSPYARANVQIQGRTQHLYLNFRNSHYIYQTCEAFRKLQDAVKEEDAKEPCTAAIRPGLPVDLQIIDDKASVSHALVQQLRFFTEILDYAPENIAIICANEMSVKKISSELAKEGMSSAVLNDRNFDFQENSTVRLTTYHSSKGLDFPVVMIYLNTFPYPVHKGLANEEHEAMTRNLLYVAMSRAMDNLLLFMPQKHAATALGQDLIAAVKVGNS